MFFDPSLPGFRNRDAKDKNQVKPQPTTTGDKSQCAFDLWVLLTRRIVDALGRRNQESFVNLKRIEKLSELVPVPSESVVRLVEVQRRQNVSIGNLDDLVQAMFPNAVGNDIDPPDATARIVRISAPIEVDARTP